MQRDWERKELEFSRLSFPPSPLMSAWFPGTNNFHYKMNSVEVAFFFFKENKEEDFLLISFSLHSTMNGSQE